MSTTNTLDYPVTQFRATDPLTSKMARKSDTLEARILGVLRTVGPCYCWELVKILNEQRSDYAPGEKKPREVTIDSVSTCMRPMARRGQVHEHGIAENEIRETGNKVIVWAAGPSPDFDPNRVMPAAHTRVPRRPMFDCFFPDEIETLNESVGRDLEAFTTALNKAILLRIHG